ALVRRQSWRHDQQSFCESHHEAKEMAGLLDQHQEPCRNGSRNKSGMAVAIDRLFGHYFKNAPRGRPRVSKSRTASTAVKTWDDAHISAEASAKIQNSI